MKRLMIVLMSIALTVPALAQYGRPYYYNRPSTMNHRRAHYPSLGTYYGLRIGTAFSTVSSDDRYLNGGSMKTGLNIGAVAGFQLGHRSPVYFETGLSYIEKGGEGRFEGSKFSYGLNYLEVPLLIKYKYDFTPDLSIQPFFGCYLAVGVGGKIKDFGNHYAYSSFDKDGFNRFDGGLKLGCGMQFDFLYAEVGYDLGLANICQDYFDTSHTGSLFATIGVNF